MRSAGLWQEGSQAGSAKKFWGVLEAWLQSLWADRVSSCGAAAFLLLSRTGLTGLSMHRCRECSCTGSIQQTTL